MQRDISILQTIIADPSCGSGDEHLRAGERRPSGRGGEGRGRWTHGTGAGSVGRACTPRAHARIRGHAERIDSFDSGSGPRPRQFEPSGGNYSDRSGGQHLDHCCLGTSHLVSTLSLLYLVAFSRSVSMKRYLWKTLSKLKKDTKCLEGIFCYFYHVLISRCVSIDRRRILNLVNYA